MKLTRDFFYLLVITLLLATTGQLYYSYHYLPRTERKIEVFYNQDIQTNKKIIQTIQEADQFVYFAIYTFTRSDIKDALLGAKHRGLEVRGITDREQTNKIELQNKIIKELKTSGIPVTTQDHTGIMHLKTLVTDKAYVSGSYNWTAAATNLNDEVIELGTDESVRSQYQRVLEELFTRYENK